MVNFLLNGINNTITNTSNFVRTSAEIESAITAPTANIYMTATEWNTLFSFGENIYHTYSGELPALNSHALNFTTNGQGTGAVLDYVTVDGSNQATALKFSSAGTGRYQVGDNLILSLGGVAATAYQLVAADLALGPVKNEITGLTTSVAAGTFAAGEYIAGPNKPDGIYSDQITMNYAGTSGVSAVPATVTIVSNKITGITWTAAGSGYATGETLSITVDGTRFATYTLIADDHTTGALKTMTGKTIAKYITNVEVSGGGGSGAVINRITILSNDITTIGFSEVGSTYAADDTFTISIDGTAFEALILTNSHLTGTIKTTELTGKTIAFTQSQASHANDIITIGTDGSGEGALADTVLVNASHQWTSTTFAGRGVGYAVGDNITLTLVDTAGLERVHAAYTLVTADVNSDGSLNDITGKTVAKASGDAYSPAPSTRHSRRSLATVKLATPAGTILQEPEESAQTIADDAIRWFMYGITGNYNQQATFSNLETINKTIDDLLTGTAASTLDDLLKTSISAANNNTDLNTDTGNLSRQLQLQLSSAEAGRLTTNAHALYNNANILSNCMGDMSGITSTNGIYTLADGLHATFDGSGTGELLESVTVRDGKVVGIKFSQPGNTHAAADKITLTGTGLRAAAFNVDGASVSALTNGAAATYTDVALTTTGGTGSLAKATVVVSSPTNISSITITTPGKGYANGDTVTLAAGTLGTDSGTVTLTLATEDIGTVAFSALYTLVAGDLDNNGGLSNGLQNFVFEAEDTLTFQCTVAPKTDATNSGQTSINYAIKIHMI